MVKRPQNSRVVDTYESLAPYIKAFAAGKLNLLIIVGNAGLQKTRQLREVVPSDSLWVEGHVTPFQLYIDLYLNRDKSELVILDDADGLIGSRDGVRLLKCLCQTEIEKTVGWHSSAARLQDLGIPTSFVTRNRVCIVANDWKTLNANVRALEDRGHLICFEPNAMEVHRQVAKWFDDAEVFEFIGAHLELLPFGSMRHYVNAKELKQAGMDWKSELLAQWLPPKRFAVARLKLDASFDKENDRASAFEAEGFGSRATYFRHAKELSKLVANDSYSAEFKRIGKPR